MILLYPSIMVLLVATQLSNAYYINLISESDALGSLLHAVKGNRRVMVDK